MIFFVRLCVILFSFHLSAGLFGDLWCILRGIPLEEEEDSWVGERWLRLRGLPTYEDRQRTQNNELAATDMGVEAAAVAAAEEEEEEEEVTEASLPPPPPYIVRMRQNQHLIELNVLRAYAARNRIAIHVYREIKGVWRLYRVVGDSDRVIRVYMQQRGRKYQLVDIRTDHFNPPPPPPPAGAATEGSPHNKKRRTEKALL